MQAAMHRRGQEKEDVSKNKEVEVSTQDYISTLDEDGAEEFNSDHWLSALDFLRQEGVTRTTSLNDIKKCVNTEKIDMVVAMIKSCTPNGLGDTMAVLKDPTDSIHASIHRKVASEGGYGREIAVGSILVLQKVSVFSPSVKSFYLNISLSNVVKIIPKDSGRRTYPASTAKDAVPDGHQNLEMAELGPSGSGGARKAFAGIQLNFNTDGSTTVEKHVGAENSAFGSQTFVDQNINIYASLQPHFIRGNSGSDIRKEPTGIDLVFFSQQVGTHQRKRRNTSSNIQPENDLRDGRTVVKPNDVGHFAARGFQKQTQAEEESSRVPLEVIDDRQLGCENVAKTQSQAKHSKIGVKSSDDQAGEANEFGRQMFLSQSKASFQRWTDEQLDILDMDDC